MVVTPFWCQWVSTRKWCNSKMEEDLYNRITLRIPRELDAKLDAEASRTSKSKNAEIISRLTQSFESDSTDAGVRLALKTLADTIRGLGEESETLIQAIEALATIAEKAASHVADEAVKLDVQRAASLARVLTNVDARRSFNVVQDELLKLASGAQPVLPAANRAQRFAQLAEKELQGTITPAEMEERNALVHGFPLPKK